MKKTVKQPARRDTETLADTLGLGLSFGNNFGLSSAPRQLTSVMDQQPTPSEKLDMKK